MNLKCDHSDLLFLHHKYLLDKRQENFEKNISNEL